MKQLLEMQDKSYSKTNAKEATVVFTNLKKRCQKNCTALIRTTKSGKGSKKMEKLTTI